MQLILSDGSEHPEPGKWIFMDRVVDPNTATIRVRAEFPNPTRVLRPGMFARVRVSLPAEEGNILMPERAVAEFQGKNFVWVIGADNKATQRSVKVAPNRVGPNAVDSGRTQSPASASSSRVCRKCARARRCSP